MTCAIPNVIHFVWLGPAMPDWAQLNIERFRALNFGRYEVVTHGEEILLDRYRPGYEAVAGQHVWARRSDLLRASALQDPRWGGGWYFDTDCCPFRPLADIEQNFDLSTGFFLVRRDRKVIANGMIGAAAGSRFMQIFDAELARLAGQPRNYPDRWGAYGPDLVTRLAAEHPKDVTIAGPEWFFPADGVAAQHAYTRLAEGGFSLESVQKEVPGGPIPFMLHTEQKDSLVIANPRPTAPAKRAADARAADIVIPTCRTEAEVAPLLAEIRRTATGSPRILATCQPVCAAANRNAGLKWAETENLIMVDDDITGFPPGWNQQLEDVLVQRAEALVVSANLLQPDGKLGQMLGHPAGREGSGVSLVPSQQLPTACICMKRLSLRFDEGYEGSGWEDTDMAAQMRQACPWGQWLVACGVRVIHRNEQKNQGGEIFQRNRARYRAKWEGTAPAPVTSAGWKSVHPLLPSRDGGVEGLGDPRWRDALRSTPPARALIPTPAWDKGVYEDALTELAGSRPLQVRAQRFMARLKTTGYEALVLADLAAGAQTIAEIGSGSGGSMLCFALGAPAARITCVDPFEPYDELAAFGLIRGVQEGDLRQFEKAVQTFHLSDRVRLVRKRSEDGQADVPDGSLNLVFIDSNHSKGSAALDLRVWWKKLRPGGLLLGHDYTTRFPGVIEAVDEWEKTEGVPVKVWPTTSIFYAVKP